MGEKKPCTKQLTKGKKEKINRILKCPKIYNQSPGVQRSNYKQKEIKEYARESYKERDQITTSSHMVEVVVPDCQMFHHLSQRNSHPKAVVSEMK